MTQQCTPGVQAVGATGREPELLQDCDRKLSRALANTPGARLHATEAAAAAGAQASQAPRYGSIAERAADGKDAGKWTDGVQAAPGHTQPQDR